MAIKNNEVLNIITKAFHGDKAMLIDYCTELMNAEKEGSTLKKQLMQILNRQPKELAQLKLDEKYAFQVLDNKNIDEVFLSEENKEIINLFFKEQQNKEKFVEHGIPVSNKIFLTGAPGNGKTTLAGAIAKEMNLPLFNFNISTLFSSYMGQTSERINSVFSKLSNIFSCSAKSLSEVPRGSPTNAVAPPIKMIGWCPYLASRFAIKNDE